MFTLELENELGQPINLNDETNYVVLKVDGLNPPSASIFTTKSYNRIGVKYNGSSIDERQLDITIKLLGDIEESRNNLYNWVSTQQYVKVHYSNGVKNVYCEGYIENCSIDFFTDNEIVELTIICPDPYWKTISDIITEISSVDANFTFPFAIEDEGIPFSIEKENTITSVSNFVDDIGVVIDIIVKNNIDNLIIRNPANVTEYIKLKEGQTLHANDHLVIDTTTIPRKITLNGENFLNGVEPNITWFKLKRGLNYFSYETDILSDVVMTVTFKEKYLGV